MEKRKDRQKEKYDETYWGTVENMKMTTRPDPKYKASIASCRVIQNRIQERQIEKNLNYQTCYILLCHSMCVNVFNLFTSIKCPHFEKYTFKKL